MSPLPGLCKKIKRNGVINRVSLAAFNAHRTILGRTSYQQGQQADVTQVHENASGFQYSLVHDVLYFTKMNSYYKGRPTELNFLYGLMQC